MAKMISTSNVSMCIYRYLSFNMRNITIVLNSLKINSFINYYRFPNALKCCGFLNYSFGKVSIGVEFIESARVRASSASNNIFLQRKTRLLTLASLRRLLVETGVIYCASE